MVAKHKGRQERTPEAQQGTRLPARNTPPPPMYSPVLTRRAAIAARRRPSLSSSIRQRGTQGPEPCERRCAPT
eukprot:scaffold1911_cov397-Prasinococcus_capsulatus_cf.AAC.26